ncbi:hypothetical protein MLD38_023917 [Melastoma candidum]|uniref:Uncharacterized protein n=1 Tax=Melastoma candidum TaxID=119954 RepID=A0ACB9NRQ4_9MYRT|nr:hypothetical protein MLD38_023917 [Melastoma candidum]
MLESNTINYTGATKQLTFRDGRNLLWNVKVVLQFNSLAGTARAYEPRYAGDASVASRERQRAVLLKKSLQLLAVTSSSAVNQASISVVAFEFIRDLTQRFEALDQETDPNLQMDVNVETLNKGFRIKVYSERSCPGLLVSILEAFEELGLNVMDAKISCSENFSLEAIGEEDEEDENIDAQEVKEAVLKAITNWSEEQNG